MVEVTTNSVTLVTDMARVVHDLVPNISMADIVEFITSIFLVARALRKVIPDNAQTGKLGEILKHAALEINPVVGVAVNDPVPQSQNTPPTILGK